MVRYPQPRPFLKPERQRPRLANVLVLLAAAPYAFCLVCFAVGAGGLVLYACVRFLLGER
jgi:hypothetical protein